jgi:serine/threonine protein kinase
VELLLLSPSFSNFSFNNDLDYPIILTFPRFFRYNPNVSQELSWESFVMGAKLGEAFVGHSGRTFVPEALVGVGGHALVYKGIDTQTGKPVAIKVFDGDRGASGVSPTQGAVREARMYRALRHRGIPRLRDWGVNAENNTSYLVVDFVDGVNLSHLISTRGRMSVDEVMPPLLDVAGALDYLHRRKQRVHGDVKPGNIIVVEADGTGRLMDFELTRSIHSAVREKDKFPELTPQFAAPEQLEHWGEPPTTASDVYSYGVTVDATLRGQVPFSNLPIEEIMQSKLRGRRPSLTQHLGSGRRVIALDEAISEATDRDPSRRPPIKKVAQNLRRATAVRERGRMVIDTNGGLHNGRNGNEWVLLNRDRSAPKNGSYHGDTLVAPQQIKDDAAAIQAHVSDIK